MNERHTTTDFGFAAYAQLEKGCLVEVFRVARGRGEFVIHLNGVTGHQLYTEFLNSPFYKFDELVRRFKKATY